MWSFDCNPAEYKVFGDMPMIVHYYRGDTRWGGALNENDGTFVGMSEIIGTPVLYRNRIYVAIGRDSSMGRGRGALQCIDAAKTGDITGTGRIWTYQGLDRTCSTVSIADGKVYMPTQKGLFVLAAGKEERLLNRIYLGAPVYSTPVAANGTLYIVSSKGWIWAVHD